MLFRYIQNTKARTKYPVFLGFSLVKSLAIVNSKNFKEVCFTGFLFDGAYSESYNSINDSVITKMTGYCRGCEYSIRIGMSLGYVTTCWVLAMGFRGVNF